MKSLSEFLLKVSIGILSFGGFKEQDIKSKLVWLLLIIPSFIVFAICGPIEIIRHLSIKAAKKE